MSTWVVQIEASFSDTVEVEAGDMYEAFEAAVREFEDSYQVVNGYGLPWDNVEATEAHEMNEDGDY